MIKILSLAAGGALGTLVRYAVSGLSYKFYGGIFPWGTLIVNISGCFVIGFLWGLFEIEIISPNARAFLFIGFLGGFTTFSTFALESLNLFRNGEAKLALLNVVASNLLGITLVILGFTLSKALLNLYR